MKTTESLRVGDIVEMTSSYANVGRPKGSLHTIVAIIDKMVVQLQDNKESIEKQHHGRFHVVYIKFIKHKSINVTKLYERY